MEAEEWKEKDTLAVTRESLFANDCLEQLLKLFEYFTETRGATWAASVGTIGGIGLLFSR